MKPLPAYFDLDSDEKRQAAFERELDNIDRERRVVRSDKAIRKSDRPAKHILPKAAQ